MASAQKRHQPEAAQEYLDRVGVPASKDPFIEVALAAVVYMEPTVVQLREIMPWAQKLRRVMAERPPLDASLAALLPPVADLYQDADYLAESVVDLLGTYVVLQQQGITGSVVGGAKVSHRNKAFAYSLHHLWTATDRQPRLTEHLLRLAAYASGHDESAPAGADKRWGRVLGQVRKQPEPLLLEAKWRPAGALLAALQQPDPAQRPTEAHSLEQIAMWVQEGGLNEAIRRAGLASTAPTASPE